MTCTIRDNGSYVHPDDPGEPSTGMQRWSVTDPEGELLAFLARGREVLEIGTGLGVSTKYLARTANAVTTVDIDPWVHEYVWPDLANLGITCASSVPDQIFDLVFIDGDHRPLAVMSDLLRAREVCPRGMIVAHDYRETQESLSGTWIPIPTQHTIGVSLVGFA